MTGSTPRRPVYAHLSGRAVRVLAARDYNEQELRRKLATSIMDKNGPEEADTTAEDYECVITQCHEHGYLDDSRFAAHLITNRSRKGHGFTRIRQELNQKGISREATEKAMHKCDID